MIYANQLSKTYGEKEILKNISILLEEGEVNVLIGPSGSGKSSLCRNLALLDLPSKGEISIDNVLYEFPSKQKQKSPYPKINFVYQQLFLWPHLTNRQNVLLPVLEQKKTKQKLFKELVDFFEVEKILNNYPNESSHGEKQRIALMRALMLESRFIFLDEITSALDIVQRNKVFQLLVKLRKQNVGVMLITHDLDFAKKIADKVFFMVNGTIVERGDVSILNSPKTEELNNFLDGNT